MVFVMAANLGYKNLKITVFQPFIPRFAGMPPGLLRRDGQAIIF
jgi:hypothetical protein